MNINPSLITLLLPVLTLSACGTDMRSWPYVDISMDVNDVSRIYIDYVSRRDESESGKYYIEDKAGIQATYEWIEGWHTNPDTCISDVSTYNELFCLYFLSENNEIEDFKAYIFSGGSTYFAQNGILRLFPADFESGVESFFEEQASYLVKVS